MRGEGGGDDQSDALSSSLSLSLPFMSMSPSSVPTCNSSAGTVRQPQLRPNLAGELHQLQLQRRWCICCCRCWSCRRLGACDVRTCHDITPMTPFNNTTRYRVCTMFDKKLSVLVSWCSIIVGRFSLRYHSPVLPSSGRSIHRTRYIPPDSPS